MRKSYFLVPLAVLVVGGAYAMTGLLFPDTPGFPRIPTGEGTVGGMIARVLGVSDLLTYSDDGSVKNTAMLSGVTASGYLMRSDICPSGQYWTGIGADGKSTCGSTTILLADMGTITEVGNGVTIYRADGTTITPVSVPTIVKSGDIIKTDGTGTGTITFSDLSVLRLDTDTTVSMDQTTSGTGVTVASALLANGSIWGRILTDTGVYNIGSSDIVAAVRGTSIVVIQTGATTSVAKDTSGKYTITKTGIQGKTQLAILDSALGTGSVTTVNCTQTTTRTIGEGGGNGSSPGNSTTRPITESITTSTATGSITPEKLYTVSPGDCTNGSSLSGSTPANLYTMSPWIKENTKKDIIYMVDLALSGSITDTTKTTKIVKELNQTTPKNSAECTNLLGSSGDCVDIVDKKTAEGDSSENPEAPIMAGCQIRNQKYWNIYRDQRDLDKKCQDSNIIAIADYRTGKPNLYFNGGIKSLTPMDEKVETYPATMLADDKGIWNHRGQGGVIDSNLFITGSMSTNITVSGKDPDAIRMSRIGQFVNGYNMAYVTSEPSKYGSSSDGWDNYLYQKITWLKPQIIPAGNLSPEGVNITGISYISYPSVLIPGGLAGKTIEIEFDNFPDGNNGLNSLGNVVLDVGNGTRVAKSGANWVCKYQNINQSSCNDSTKFSIKPHTDGSNILEITMGSAITPEYLVIGNSKTSTFTQPVNKLIKSIRIKN